jgi:hypothetical protein
MHESTLFPHEEVQMFPAAERTEPTLWIRRLVILPSFEPTVEPIRDIEFRRGLNIIQTTPRMDSDAEVVGHSVGKTLLTRLIRYSLGEVTYSSRSERSRILERLPDACVVAHWSVAGIDWCVFRPLQPHRQSKPFAIRSAEWTEVFGESENRLVFGDFTQAVENACFSNLPKLPNSDLNLNRWGKALAFMTRDWQCGYRQFNDWRNSDSESGITIERNDASRLLRWLMDLIDVEELPLWDKHQSLLDDQRRLTQQRRSASQFLDATASDLLRKIDVDDLGDGLFSAKLTAKVEEKINQLRSLLHDALEDSVLQELERREVSIQDELNDVSLDLGKRHADIEYLARQLETRRNGDDSEAYTESSAFENCALAACPMKLTNRLDPEQDPANQGVLDLLQQEIQDRDRELNQKIQERDQLKARHADLRKNLREERERISEQTAGIERTIGRWETYREDVARRIAASKAILDVDHKLRRVAVDLKASNEVQKGVREDQRRRLNLMSERFSTVQREIFGVAANGKFKLTAFGLEPEVDSRLALGGAALSAMAQVLSFDLVCLISSVAGLGHHSRFMIHDSPRSRDIEEQLFHQLFRVVLNWESLFLPEEASFQYIITTTTLPPVELADPELGLVRLTLSARSEDQRLLPIQY